MASPRRRSVTVDIDMDDGEAALLFEKIDAAAAVERQAAINALIERRRQAAITLLSRELRLKLSNGWVRVNDLFKSWDANGDGLITRREFMRGICVVGVQMSHDDVSQLFSVFDKDGSGMLDYRELNGMMRRGSMMVVPTPGSPNMAAITSLKGERRQSFVPLSPVASPRPAAAGADESGKRRGSSVLGGDVLKALGIAAPANGGGGASGATDEIVGGVSLEGLQGEELLSAVRVALAERRLKVQTLFRQWDEDGSGTVTLAEFRGAIAALGLSVPPAVAERLFGAFDPDRSGHIEYAELGRVLRQWAESSAAAGGGERRHSVTFAAVGAGDGNGRRGSLNGSKLGGKLRKTMFGAALKGASGERKEEVLDRLRGAVDAVQARLLDLFRSWDHDGSGEVSKKEFSRGLAALGLAAASPEQALQLFEHFDQNGDGVIEVRPEPLPMHAHDTPYLPKPPPPSLLAQRTHAPAHDRRSWRVAVLGALGVPQD